MNRQISHWRHACLAALVLAGACTAAPKALSERGAPMSDALARSEAAGAPGKAERVADALMAAAKAESAQHPAALAHAALLLDHLGAAPQTEADAAAMTRWRSAIAGSDPPVRGRALGPAYRSGALHAGASTELNQTFLGGRAAQIVVRVSKGSSPRLVVRDHSNRQVCAADNDPITCRWVPLYTQRHRIELVNDGPQVSEFYIVFD